MKKTLIALSLLLSACGTTPVIIPDTTADNVVMMQLKDHISQPGPPTPSYGWLFWYSPLAILGLMWGYRNLIKKPINCLEEEPISTTVGSKIKQVSIDK